MDYVNLGRTGLRVSRVCLGMMSWHALMPVPSAPGDTRTLSSAALMLRISIT